REGTVTVEYVNAGETDVTAPLMLLESDNARFRLSEQDQYVDDRIRLLGINRNGPAGVLPPGARGSITVTFLPKTFGAHVFSHFTLAVPGPDVPLDWSGNKDALRPESVPANAWDAVYAGFRAGVGTTVGQLQAALAANATRLSQH